MGAGNVKLAYARWPDLPDLPFRLLVYMAVVSMDEDAQPSFWGGWESLALAGGRLVPPACDDKEVVKVRRAALKAVNGAIGKLLDRGAIVVKTAAAPGRNTTYVLNFAYRTVHAERAPSRDAGQSNGSRSADTTVHPQPTNGSPSAGLTVHPQREPEEYEEQVRTQPEEEIAGVDLTVTGPRANDADANPDSSDAVLVPRLRLVAPTVGSRRWSSRGTDTIAESMARRAAAIAARQAGDAS